jgi:tRNA pseudouridine38-40 synthase
VSAEAETPYYWLLVAYNGSAFEGSQWQHRHDRPPVRTVEAVLREAFTRLGKHVSLRCATRTDAGVHAYGQVVQVKPASLQDDLASLPHPLRSLNAVLPPDCQVVGLEAVSPQLPHPQQLASHKWYRYLLYLGDAPHPLMPPTALWCKQADKLSLVVMQTVAHWLQGESRCYTSLKQAGSPTHHNDECLLTHVAVTPLATTQPIWAIDVVGNRFLRKMVRNLVALLLQAAQQPMPEQALAFAQQVLAANHAQALGRTAPSHGLSLMAIHFAPPSRIPLKDTDTTDYQPLALPPFYHEFVYGKLLSTLLNLETSHEHENLFRQTC